MLQLMLMRHGKSDWDAGTTDDHSRPLTGRGVRSATLMGRFLGESGRAPDLIITSSAMRASRTADLIKATLDPSPPLIVEDDLYGSGPEKVVAAISRLGGSADRVLAVGHEPTWSKLVEDLVGARTEMKTASVAGVGLLVEEWSSLVGATGWLDFLVHPRMLFDSPWDPHGD